MRELTSDQIEQTRKDTVWFLDEFDRIFKKMISKQEYTGAHSKASQYAEESILMSMVSYRHDNDIDAAKRYLADARLAIVKTQELAELVGTMDGLDVSTEPNCLLPVFLEYPISVALLNKNINGVSTLYEVYCSDVMAKKRSFPFAQQFARLLMLGALDKKTEFREAYTKFSGVKKDKGEQWFAHYVDMLAAIVERDQGRFDSLLLDAEEQMKNHGTSKRWGDDVMSGGLEYNSIVYDYQGTAMCCLALMRGMQVNHFSCYYPEEIILAK